jgi:hypothetical protein
VANWVNISGRGVLTDEQQLYDHLLLRVEVDPPEQLIRGFCSLFIDGYGYADREMHAIVDSIVLAKQADHDFKFILNRCCHILINRWQTRPYDHPAIPELIGLFERIPSKAPADFSRHKAIRRLRELTTHFTQTEQYAALRRLAQVMSYSADASGINKQPLGTLIRRYPYLYEHCLLTDGARQEQQQTIRELQTQVQRQFEIDLTQYVTYRVRRAQLARSANGKTQHLIQPVKNPTLLDDHDLALAVKHFAGKVEGSDTYRDLAQRFITHTSQGLSFRAFKDDLYQYLISSIDPSYGKRRFNDQLYNQLKNTMPDSNSQQLNDMLMVKTCSQLLNFLVVESSQHPQHFVFVDLVTNLGPTSTIGIVVKVVLICQKVTPYLEKRFSILFNHYEASPHDVVQWLVNCLENLNVAFSINLGTADLSFIK